MNYKVEYSKAAQKQIKKMGSIYASYDYEVDNKKSCWLY